MRWGRRCSAGPSSWFACWAPGGWAPGYRVRAIGFVADDHGTAVAPENVTVRQVNQGRHAVAAAEQVDQMQGEPGEPGERAAQPQSSGQLDHGGPAPDRGHGALVVVLEGFGGGIVFRLALQLDDLRGGMP